MTSPLVGAFEYAARIHAGHAKFGAFPLIAHLLAVTAIVIEHGGDETAAIGALLHDAAEEAGGRSRLDDIRARFGGDVAEIVEGCTDSLDGGEADDWRELKSRYIAKIPATSAATQLVSAADKLHNIRALVMLDKADPAIWDRIKGGREGRLWYYRALLGAYRAAGPNPVIPTLACALGQLESALAA